MARYRHLAVDYTSPVKFAIINGVLIVAPQSKSVISSEVTPVIKWLNDIVPEDSPNKLPLMWDTTPYAIESGSDKFTFQSGEVDSDIDKEITRDDISLNYIKPTPSTHLSVIRTSTHLSVIRCVPSQPTEKDY